MTLFLIVCAALTLAVLARLLWPLWRSARPDTLTLADLNSKVYRDQLRELERDLARGQLTAANYEEARDELQRRLLQDVENAGTAPTASAPVRGRWTAIALAVLVPLGAAGLYTRVGNAAAIDAQANAAAASPENVRRVVGQLAEALEKSPNNPQGWVLLARAYTKMERFDDAVAAYDRAAPLVEKTADLLVEQADVLTAASGDNLEGRPMALVRKALTLEPKHPMGLMLMGMSAYRRGQHAEAIGHWQALMQVLPPDSEESRQVQANIDQARREGSVPAGAAAPVTAQQPPQPTTAPPGQPAATATAGAGVSGEVVLSPELTAQLRPDDVLFIVARPDDGSRAPVAVLRRKASELPLRFTLDDTMAMIPDRTVSKAKAVIVVARISRSGQPIAQPGDLTSEPSAPVAPGTTGLKLSISRQL